MGNKSKKIKIIKERAVAAEKPKAPKTSKKPFYKKVWFWLIIVIAIGAYFAPITPN